LPQSHRVTERRAEEDSAGAAKRRDAGENGAEEETGVAQGYFFRVVFFHVDRPAAQADPPNLVRAL
jgi:hypothetical protein